MKDNVIAYLEAYIDGLDQVDDFQETDPEARVIVSQVETLEDAVEVLRDTVVEGME